MVLESDTYRKSLHLAQAIQNAEESLGIADIYDAAVAAAAKRLGVIGATFTASPDGYRYQGVNVEAEASTLGTHPNSQGPGLLFQVPGVGSLLTRPSVIRGPRISTSLLDTPEIFYAHRQYKDFRAWDNVAPGLAHPDLQMNVPVAANVSYLIIVYSEVQLWPATTTSQLFTRIRIAMPGETSTTIGDGTWEAGSPPLSKPHGIQAGVQQWQTVSAVHLRYVCVETDTPADAGEPIAVENWVYREGTAGQHRMGNGYTVALRLPV